jgi:ParB/RepB/Spo0J family partition protein
MSSTDKGIVARAIGVKEVATNDLHPNPHNPRLLFDREPMKVLEQSIEKVGILVPLTVYRDSKRDFYVILDGQRRWTCACAIGLKKVPVNEVAEPTLVQNIVTMFQIHKLRQDWELMPTALKLELLMKELKERKEERLSKLTGLPEAVVSRCKKLLSFPKKFQDLMLDASPEKRVKADFFIELYPVVHDREIVKMDWFAPVKFTEQMLQKYGEGKPVKSVTDFRLVKQYITNARRYKKLPELAQKLKKFAEDPNEPLSALKIESADVAAEARRILGEVVSLHDIVVTLDVEKFFGEKALWDELERLRNSIGVKLREADRRFE